MSPAAAEAQIEHLGGHGWRAHRLTAFAGDGELVILTHPEHYLPLQGMGPLAEVVPALHVDALRYGDRQLLSERYPGVPRTETAVSVQRFDQQLTLPELVLA